jgi:hypothetical protein
MKYSERRDPDNSIKVTIEINNIDLINMRISEQDKRYFTHMSKSDSISDKIGALHKLSMIWEQSQIRSKEDENNTSTN